MLTALELSGFKSFAEKTRFDFPDGITVIVGPNGSGKSNVVDAIKWVLGAQSAKSLRGKEMIDVIFKGSSSSGRKPLNSAEATLVFDNREKRLSVDATEVHVTRRVYRSGEGEYLINGQACRLKDIRNLFRGTGVGVDAYSLIEQGKVDRMLQASPKDRRMIFEEAAGISRFNAKKAEANRRLDRVEQNLVRLKDIVDEVYGRLSRLKSQASKAQRYREMTSRLHQLRTRLGWTDYTHLIHRTDEGRTRLLTLAADLEQQQSEFASARENAKRAEMDLHAVAEDCQRVEATLQDLLQKIAVCRNQQQALRDRISDVDEAGKRQGVRVATLRARVATVQAEAQRVADELAEAQKTFDLAENQANQAASSALQLRTKVAEQREQCEQWRATHRELTEKLEQNRQEIHERQQRWRSLQQAAVALKTKLTEAKQADEAAAKISHDSALKLEEIRAKSDEAQKAYAEAKHELNELQSQRFSQQERAGIVQGELTGSIQRLAMLEQLQQQLDGVDAGARYLIELAQSSRQDPVYASVHGLMADLLKADIELAPLIDTALGANANVLVLQDGRLIQQIRSGKLEIPGRLSLMRLDRIPPNRFGEKVQLEGVQGVIGRADRLVRCKEKFLPIIRYFLGTTWIVESLDVALDLGHFRGAGLRFVSSAGELIEADGLLTLGAMQSSTGLVSRRSEIEAAKIEIARLKTEQQQLQDWLSEHSQRHRELRPRVDAMEAESQQLAQETARQQALSQSADDSLQAIREQTTKLLQAKADHDRQSAELEPEITALKGKAEQLQTEHANLDLRLQEGNAELAVREQELARVTETETTARVKLARAEEKRGSIRENLAQMTESGQERQTALREAEIELEENRRKRKQNELEILSLTSELAEAYLASEREEAALDILADRAAELRRARAEAAKELENASRSVEKTKRRQETCELELERDQESLQTLVSRFEEDYRIDLASITDVEIVSDAGERKTLDAEATQLRQDIAGVGEINMAALAELDELQSRYDYLNGQYEDLVAAKESLQRIIQKINQDSRRMFSETLQIIRENFQKLYRKSFGGGNADIVLEEGQDVLEGGIEIIATPPGKTALSNSLLSGGEKALTAVALLLAIFQFRPSPFCVLDEVDAPFDEANIGRFVNVLNEFLDWTKFIIVTHSKKTMTSASTLYGVTMEESGVSKQVAVRFEDVNDKGEIVNRRVA